MKHILCFSGGKDSTAMLITCLKKEKPIDEILYVDVGDWMWGGGLDHIHNVEKKYGVHITVLNVSDELREGFKKWGFPSFINRWCTGIKREAMKRYLRKKYPNEEIIQYIGYCADEQKRTSKKLYSTYQTEYPLVDENITTKECLELCKEEGFDFQGVYEHHTHYNCWLCPLQRVDELRVLYNQYPKLWEQLYHMQKKTCGYFNNKKTIFDFEKKFWLEQQDQLKKQMMEARK